MDRPTWTDAELLNHDFNVLDRPDRSEADLSVSKPPSGTRFRFVKDYNIAPPLGVPNRRAVQPLVWCALCQEATHWSGWVAEYEDDGGMVRCLIGQVCARRNGGEAVKLAARDYEANRRRADVLKTRHAVLPLIGPALKALEQWGASEEVGAVMTWRAALRSLSEPFFNAVTAAAQSSPPILLLEVEVRDLAAEERVAARRGKSFRGEPIYVTQFKPIGPIVGHAMYAATPPDLRIRRMIEGLREAWVGLHRQSDGRRTKDLQDAITAVRKVCDAARELEDTYRDASKALTVEALDVLIGWYSKTRRSEWEAPTVVRKGRTLVVDRDWGAKTAAVIPDPVSIARPPILDSLEAALIGGRASPAST